MAGARGIFLPATQAIQHDAFPEEIRSTGLPMMNFSVEAMIAVSYFASASSIDNINAGNAWFISTGAFSLSALLIFIHGRKFIRN